ncbi:hypothetical protein CV102_18160 [Natronococcus pandeyae]|uniref:Uncharacterized protein n=1 Tax=Natronococcus pandeyae TaxID=2055836 RepID=A0A8J8TR05_9EURY|nr:hypothetical protein [Natronococcus pandeyae]TYL37239.1 hypothetical protein CV102_18160 [Natronococcus pandeyae]
MSDNAVLIHPRNLARTYSSQAYEDPWEIVEDYQRVLEYTGRQPNAGSQRVASKLNLPRSRIRPWMDGSIPHPVRAIQTAETRDWLPLTEDTDAFDPLNRLVAWGCSQGTLKNEIFAPYFIVHSDEDRERITGLLEQLDLEPVEERTEDKNRSAEVRVSDNGAILGRVLYTLDVPLDDEALNTLPSYLDSVSEPSKRVFARTYLENRGQYWEFNSRWILEHSNRTGSYRRSLASFYADLGADVEVHEDTISIDSDFARDLLDDE